MCHEEVDKVLFESKCGANIPYEDITKFVYLGQVIKEALRLHPPVQIMARLNMEESQVGAYRMPPNAVFGICVLAVHHHPDFWDRPKEFLPDRFSADNIKATIKHPFQYIPFSFGPRHCIGQRFATLEATTILALILQNFSINMEADDILGTKIEETITCSPRSLHVTLTPRKCAY